MKYLVYFDVIGKYKVEVEAKDLSEAREIAWNSLNKSGQLTITYSESHIYPLGQVTKQNESEAEND
jgi:hypothetical protein